MRLPSAFHAQPKTEAPAAKTDSIHTKHASKLSLQKSANGYCKLTTVTETKQRSANGQNLPTTLSLLMAAVT